MIWIFIVGLALFFLIWWGKRPNYYRGIELNDFHRFFLGLIKQGTDGTLMLISHQSSKRFIQYAKYITNESGIIINFGFPDAPWSRKYFEPIVETLKAANLTYEIHQTSDDSKFVKQFVDVNLNVRNTERSVSELCDLAKLAFKAMNVKETDKFRIHFDGNLRIDSIRDKSKAREDAGSQ